VKHELKLAIIYLIGQKLRYDEIKKIWRGRLEFALSKHDKNLATRGVSYEYFAYVAELLLSNMRAEKRALINFKAIDSSNKGFIDYAEFK
jgi:hypothetical protein